MIGQVTQEMLRPSDRKNGGSNLSCFWYVTKQRDLPNINMNELTKSTPYSHFKIGSPVLIKENAIAKRRNV